MIHNLRIPWKCLDILSSAASHYFTGHMLITLLHLYCGGFQRLSLPPVSESCLEILVLKKFVNL